MLSYAFRPETGKCFLQLAVGFQLSKSSLKCELEHYGIALRKLNCNFTAAILCCWVYSGNAVVHSGHLSIWQGAEICFGEIPFLYGEVVFEQHCRYYCVCSNCEHKRGVLQCQLALVWLYSDSQHPFNPSDTQNECIEGSFFTVMCSIPVFMRGIVIHCQYTVAVFFNMPGATLKGKTFLSDSYSFIKGKV